MTENNSDDKQKDIFRKNLTRFISDSGKTQIEIATAIGVSQQTFNTWCRGVALPRIGKIERLADFFGCRKSDLLEEQKSQQGKTTTPEEELCLSLFNRLNADEKLKALTYMQSIVIKREV